MQQVRKVCPHFSGKPLIGHFESRHTSPDDPILASQLTQRHEIWRTLIWIMFLVIGVEFMLSTLRARRREAHAGFGVTARRWLQEAITG